MILRPRLFFQSVTIELKHKFKCYLSTIISMIHYTAFQIALQILGSNRDSLNLFSIKILLSCTQYPCTVSRELDAFNFIVICIFLPFIETALSCVILYGNQTALQLALIWSSSNLCTTSVLFCALVDSAKCYLSTSMTKGAWREYCKMEGPDCIPF